MKRTLKTPTLRIVIIRSHNVLFRVVFESKILNTAESDVAITAVQI